MKTRRGAGDGRVWFNSANCLCRTGYSVTFSCPAASDSHCQNLCPAMRAVLTECKGWTIFSFKISLQSSTERLHHPVTLGELRVPLRHLTPTPSTPQSPPGAVRLGEPPPPPSRLAKCSQSEPPTWRGISHGAGHAAGVPIDCGFPCVCSLLNLSADPASGRRDPGATGELQRFAGTEPARLGGFSTRCADSTSSAWRSRG